MEKRKHHCMLHFPNVFMPPVIQMMNRYGLCMGYDGVESINTGLRCSKGSDPCVPVPLAISTSQLIHEAMDIFDKENTPTLVSVIMLFLFCFRTDRIIMKTFIYKISKPRPLHDSKDFMLTARS